MLHNVIARCICSRRVKRNTSGLFSQLGKSRLSEKSRILFIGRSARSNPIPRSRIGVAPAPEIAEGQLAAAVIYRTDKTDSPSLLNTMGPMELTVLVDPGISGIWRVPAGLLSRDGSPLLRFFILLAYYDL